MVKKSMTAMIGDMLGVDPAAAQILDKIMQKNPSVFIPGLKPGIFDSVHERYPTGIVGLDKLSGMGGFPKGRWVQVWGKPKSGKTTLCLSCVANWQKAGLQCAWIDAEFRFDDTWAQKLGVDTNKLIFMRPESGDDALNAAAELSSVVNIIVLDSVACLMPVGDLKKDVGESSQRGATAHLINQLIQRNTKKFFDNGVTMVAINQTRAKDTKGFAFAKDTAPPGGYKLQHTLVQSYEVNKRESVRDNGVKVGSIVGVTCDLSSVNMEGGSVSLRLMNDRENNLYGIDVMDDLLSMAVEYGIVKEKGRIFHIGEKQLGRRGETRTWLEKHPKSREQIYNKLLSVFQHEQEMADVEASYEEVAEVEFD